MSALGGTSDLEVVGFIKNGANYCLKCWGNASSDAPVFRFESGGRVCEACDDLLNYEDSEEHTNPLSEN